MIEKKHLIFLFCILSFTSLKSLNESQIEEEIKKIQNLPDNNPHKIIAISTDIYRIARNRGYKKGILTINSLLINKYCEIGNFKKAIEICDEIEKLAGKNDTILVNSHRLKASVYLELNANYESFQELKRALKTADKLESQNDKNYMKALVYKGFVTYFSHVNASIDSVMYYQNECLESAMSIDDNKDFQDKKYHTLAVAYMNLGMMNIALGNTKEAINKLSKALGICQDEKYHIHKDLEVSILNELAWTYYDQKNYDKAAHYADQAEREEKKAGMPYVRRDVFEIAFKTYSSLKKKALARKYTNLYIQLNDSLVNVEKNVAGINRGKSIIGKQEGSTGRKQDNIVIWITLAIILIICIVVWKKLYKPSDIVNTGNSVAGQNEPLEVPNEKNINIPDYTTRLILDKLAKFEKSQKFIKKDISLSSLASDLDTNTRYLSAIIKQHKKKSYSSYINGLRIAYIKTKLIEDRIYREYKISYLADECGFSSREVFAVTFKKDTGITPSYFISSLNDKSVQDGISLD
ncbi:tetratricopeptide repeat protein [Chryseobacterium lathyri]|uniref:AraC-like DNA-binding protein n=2 Tax=Chryseobacterium lathyri TaxID=395933 RepID=A0ABT9SUW7_9FLAO|nr:tetratricopeptide repeat protein [Chryseobacterium lathyri]MDP9962250.1 AraC-like DNA-binding protein [Chryseobacterium lathyri]